MKMLKKYLVLCKAGISILAACSAATGYLLSPGNSWSLFFLTLLGVYILASGSSALNQWQEWQTDALMNRTKSRPIPSGKMTPTHAFITAVLLIFVGLVILQMISEGNATVLGALAVLWYNGIYTPLKKKTAFAAVPGGVVGALPPAIGWITGGGSISDPRILALGLFLFVWQIPHFWLLLLKYGDEYHHAGFPTLTQTFGTRQVARLTFTWIVATVAVSFVLPLFDVVPPLYFIVTIGPGVVWLFYSALKLLKSDLLSVAWKKTFHVINAYLLLVMVAFSLLRVF